MSGFSIEHLRWLILQWLGYEPKPKAEVKKKPCPPKSKRDINRQKRRKR